MASAFNIDYEPLLKASQNVYNLSHEMRDFAPFPLSPIIL